MSLELLQNLSAKAEMPLDLELKLASEPDPELSIASANTGELKRELSWGHT